ncbi:MAG: class I SAM-dependent methyltransferase [Campylobacteraceae bacterium]|nr:class I SAM-dependent methyltransferase [Campylobacteraceae bacterium]
MENLNNYIMNHNPKIDEVFHQYNIENIGNVVYWLDFFSKAKSVKGDVVECGVGRGRSLLTIATLNEFLSNDEGGNRRIYAYDSFEGFPVPSKEDTSKRNPKEKEWSHSVSGKYKYSVEFTENVLREAGVTNFENIVITKGYFNESLIHHPKRKIAILHVDGDLYNSYIDTLTHLYPLVETGGIVVFDDFQAVDGQADCFPGARQAVNDFFGERIANLKVSLAGKYYLIKD